MKHIPGFTTLKCKRIAKFWYIFDCTEQQDNSEAIIGPYFETWGQLVSYCETHFYETKDDTNNTIWGRI